jgi:hypothetical protein
LQRMVLMYVTCFRQLFPLHLAPTYHHSLCSAITLVVALLRTGCSWRFSCVQQSKSAWHVHAACPYGTADSEARCGCVVGEYGSSRDSHWSTPAAPGNLVAHQTVGVGVGGGGQFDRAPAGAVSARASERECVGDWRDTTELHSFPTSLPWLTLTPPLPPPSSLRAPIMRRRTVGTVNEHGVATDSYYIHPDTHTRYPTLQSIYASHSSANNPVHYNSKQGKGIVYAVRRHRLCQFCGRLLEAAVGPSYFSDMNCIPLG